MREVDSQQNLSSSKERLPLLHRGALASLPSPGSHRDISVGWVHAPTAREIREEDRWGYLCPTEILVLVFGHLDAKSLVSASGTCWRWYEIINQDYEVETYLWRGLTMRHFETRDKYRAGQTWREDFIERWIDRVIAARPYIPPSELHSPPLLNRSHVLRQPHAEPVKVLSLLSLLSIVFLQITGLTVLALKVGDIKDFGDPEWADFLIPFYLLDLIVFFHMSFLSRSFGSIHFFLKSVISLLFLAPLIFLQVCITMHLDGNTSRSWAWASIITFFVSIIPIIIFAKLLEKDIPMFSLRTKPMQRVGLMLSMYCLVFCGAWFVDIWARAVDLPQSFWFNHSVTWSGVVSINYFAAFIGAFALGRWLYDMNTSRLWRFYMPRLTYLHLGLIPIIPCLLFMSQVLFFGLYMDGYGSMLIPGLVCYALLVTLCALAAIGCVVLTSHAVVFKRYTRYHEPLQGEEAEEERQRLL